MPGKIRKRRQMGFEDQVVNNKELEAVLEEREAVLEAHTLYREKTKAAQAKVKDLGTEGSFRCGRFVITVKPKESRHVEFEQGSRMEIGFSLAEERK